jgi:hypothetical protein
MAQPSGQKMMDCPYCKGRYLRTNFMYRKAGFGKDSMGRIIRDTHENACWRKQQGSNDKLRGCPIEKG